MKLTAFLLTAFPLYATTTFVLDFDEAPPTNGAEAVESYEENGFQFTGTFALGSSSNSGRASNSSVGYLELLIGNEVTIVQGDNNPFNAVSVDLSEFSSLFPDAISVTFVGTFPDNSEVSHTFTTDGIFDSTNGVDDFETIFFPDTFQDLVSLSTTSSPFTLDNLVIEAIPEPSVIFLCSTCSLVIFRRHRR